MVHYVAYGGNIQNVSIDNTTTTLTNTNNELQVTTGHNLMKATGTGYNQLSSTLGYNSITSGRLNQTANDINASGVGGRNIIGCLDSGYNLLKVGGVSKIKTEATTTTLSNDYNVINGATTFDTKVNIHNTFSADAGPNTLSLYEDNDYGFGIDAFTLKYLSKSNHKFYSGSTSTSNGTEKLAIGTATTTLNNTTTKIQSNGTDKVIVNDPNGRTQFHIKGNSTINQEGVKLILENDMVGDASTRLPYIEWKRDGVRYAFMGYGTALDGGTDNKIHLGLEQGSIFEILDGPIKVNGGTTTENKLISTKTNVGNLLQANNGRNYLEGGSNYIYSNASQGQNRLYATGNSSGNVISAEEYNGFNQIKAALTNTIYVNDVEKIKTEAAVTTISNTDLLLSGKISSPNDIANLGGVDVYYNPLLSVHSWGRVPSYNTTSTQTVYFYANTTNGGQSPEANPINYMYFPVPYRLKRAMILFDRDGGSYTVTLVIRKVNTWGTNQAQTKTFTYSQVSGNRVAFIDIPDTDTGTWTNKFSSVAPSQAGFKATLQTSSSSTSEMMIHFYGQQQNV